MSKLGEGSSMTEIKESRNMSIGAEEKKFTVGTLSYSKHGLWILFFWLMWNDFTITLLEQVTSLTTVLMKDRGASYTLMSYFGLVGGLLGMWINPFFSTWSDRLRTKFGRRRPILFFSVPLFAVSLAAIPFMPDLYHFLMRFPSAAFVLGLVPIDGEILFIGVACVINTLLNAVVLAIFSYLYWDVVPEIVLGRFNSIAKIVTVGASLIWSFFIVGHAEHHAKEVYIGVSVFCLGVYLLSLWRVKEGGYPDPQPQSRAGFMGPIKSYFDDCFSHSFYLWIFVGTLLFQIGNQGNNFQFFYLRNDLHLDFEATGWINGVGQTVTVVFGLLLGYSAGSMIDRLKPIRVIPVCFFFWSIANVVGFFTIHDKISAAVISGVINVNTFIFSVAVAAVTVELFPREKLGQFCSAQAFFHQTTIMVLNPLIISPLFDYIKFNRLSYLWSATFYFLAGLVYVKVYFNWKLKQEAALQTSSIE